MAKQKKKFPEKTKIQNEVEKIDDIETEDFSNKKEYEGTPLVVIAGRPNVGKSTLFNRFMRRRLAIVAPTPGVTRDGVEGTAIIAGKPVRLVDTGGYKLDREIGTQEAQMDALVVEKTLSFIKKADKIVLLLEAGKITGEDEEFISILRPFMEKVVVGVNKCEGGNDENTSWNYLKYGFKEIVFISASHGDHITEFAEKIVANLDFSKVREIAEDEKPIRIAILGKPNTGIHAFKSTHTFKFFDCKRLRGNDARRCGGRIFVWRKKV